MKFSPKPGTITNIAPNIPGIPLHLNATVDNLEEATIEAALEEAGIETEIYETFTSRPSDKINLPEIKSANAAFVYNFYTQDERVRPGTANKKDRIVSLHAGNSEEIFFQSKNERLPRFVKINIKPAKISDELISFQPLRKLGLDLDRALDMIVTEGATSKLLACCMKLLQKKVL